MLLTHLFTAIGWEFTKGEKVELVGMSCQVTTPGAVEQHIRVKNGSK